ncbi:unnamed protein product [Cylicocyclus nassatus]|uniref:Uncharacterized protein n=1 Tax=Cylicocyclus nassatus TaxID=53992 RepID=A0AA36HDI1_CYLNA|nr:unnamed protein product [Cylicocyclus nassatus]
MVSPVTENPIRANTCIEPLKFTDSHLKVGHNSDFFGNLMRAVVGHLEPEARQEFITIITTHSDENIPNSMWTNTVFLIIFFAFLAIAFVLLATLLYRLVTKWTKFRRRMKHKPRTLLGSGFVLILGVVSSSCLIAVISRWSSNFKDAEEFRSYMMSTAANDSYFVAYSKAMLCSASNANETALSSFKAQYGSLLTELNKYTTAVGAVKVSRKYLEQFMKSTEECNGTELEDLRKYVKSQRKSKHESFLTVAVEAMNQVHNFRKAIFSMFSTYESIAKQVIKQIGRRTINLEEKIADFVVTNESTFSWQFVIRLHLILPIALIIVCASGALCLLFYSISTFFENQSTSDSFNSQTRIYEKGARLLNCCGFFAMVISIMFFVSTALLFYVGYSSGLICNAFADYDFGDYQNSSVSFAIAQKKFAIKLKYMYERCRGRFPFYEAMSLRPALSHALTIEDSSSHIPDLNRKLDSVLAEDLAKVFGDHFSQLMKALQLKSKLNTNEISCVKDPQSFNDSLAQIKEYAQIIGKASAETNADSSAKYLEKLVKGIRSCRDLPEFRRIFLNDVDNSLRNYSIQCGNLASAVDVVKSFCLHVPVHYQGIWVVFGMTAIVSIHVVTAMFKVSDFLMPTEKIRISGTVVTSRLAATGSKRKPSAEPFLKSARADLSRSQLAAFLTGESPGKAKASPHNNNIAPGNAHAPSDDAGQMYGEDKLND